MNSFAGGLLIGFACGLWFAILLYWLAGKRMAYLSAAAASPPQPKAAAAPAAPPQPDAHLSDDGSADDALADDALADEDDFAPPEEPPADDASPSQADAGTSRYTRLVSMTGGDAAKAERLIDYERKRAPDAARSIWIQNAIDRLIHDRT